MSRFPYAQTRKSLKGVLEKIPKVGVPASADHKWLSSLGFGEPNDQAVIKVLQFLDFVDDSGRPTDRWSSYRNHDDSKSVMTVALREAYADLFAQHARPEEVSSNELGNFFRAHSKLGSDAVRKSVSTFTTLCEFADLSTENGSRISDSRSRSSIHGKSSQKNGNSVRPPRVPDELSWNVNIQIHISPSADADQIDNIFRSMAKHLYSVDAN